MSLRSTVHSSVHRIHRYLAVAASVTLLSTIAAVSSSAPASAAQCQAYATPPTSVAAIAVQGACNNIGIQYAWGGGHGPKPGPSMGNLQNPNSGTRGIGLDCSGYVRLAYYLGTGTDIFGAADSSRQWSNRTNYGFTQVYDIKPGDLLHYPGHIAIALGGGYMAEAPNFGTVTKVSAVRSGWEAMRYTAAAPTKAPLRDRISDWSGDGYADVLALGTDMNLYWYPNNAKTLTYSHLLTKGFQGYTSVMSADWSADGYADVLGVDGAGQMWYFPNNGLGIQASIPMGTGWNSFGYTTLMAADWSGDGYADILALDNAGVLWYYPHNGSALGSRQSIGTGFKGFQSIMAADFYGDGRADILAVNSYGQLFYYPNLTGAGLTSGQVHPVGNGTGFNKLGYTKIFASDFSGDGAADILALDSAGTLYWYPHNGSGLSPRIVLTRGFGTTKVI